jgi:DNA polymerase-1
MGLKDKNKDQKELEKSERVRIAKDKKEKATYIPTWEEVWYTGYNGKKAIFQTKIGTLDKERLMTVKNAIDSGEIGMHCESIKKFSKSHALNLYKMLMEYRKVDIIKEMVLHKPDNYHLINHKGDFEYFLHLLHKEKIVGLDTETTGLDYDKDEIVGISFTLPKADYHCYIPIRHDIVGIIQLSPSYVFNALKPFLLDNKLGKVLHNAKFDFHMFWREGIYVDGLVMDTLIAMKILNENELKYALKNISTKYGKFFGFEDRSLTYEELFGKGGFEKTPLDIGTVYACKDTHLCYELYLWIDEQFKKLPKLGHIYYDIELPNTITAFDMEKNGFLIDTVFATEYTEQLREQVKEMEVKIVKEFGDININSNQQLAHVIYDVWELEDISGKKSVKADVLKVLAEENEILQSLLDYRGLAKLLSTYFEAIPQKIWKRDGRLHGQFNQSGTKTGRYSSNNPNLQNIPPEARPMVVAPVGKVIIGKDLSQIEPRCLAYLSEDVHFQEPYLTGKDLYSTLASSTFKIPLEYCLDGAYDPTGTFKPRKRMKTGLLAVMYGTSTYTLSKQLGITLQEADDFINTFLETYPQTRDYIQGIKDFIDKNEYVETAEGRKRRFPHHREVAIKYKDVCKKIVAILGHVPSNIWESKLPRNIKREYWNVAKNYGRVARQGVNAKIQGSSADYIKQVMYRVNNYLKSLGEEYKMIATIHDEILMEVPDTITKEQISELDHIMTSIEWFDFPVKTDTVVMYAWGQEINVKDWLENREEYNIKRCM